MKKYNSVYILAALIILLTGCAKSRATETDASRWTKKLFASLDGTNKLRIRSGGTCHQQVEKQKTLLETDDVESINTLIRHIQINDAESGFHCMCCGTPTFEFYKDEQIVVSLGFHHGQSLRWAINSQWTSDARLTEKSAEYLIHWLADRNVKGPLNEILSAKNKQEEMEAKLERATRNMPAPLKKSVSSDKFKKTFKSTYISEAEQIDVLLFMLGTSNGSWSSYDWIDKIPDDLLRTYDSEALQTAVRKALLGNDRKKRRGAARLWEAWRSPLENWNPPDHMKLHRVILTVQQESAYYPLRQQALGNLRSWSNALEKKDVERRLRIGLLDPNESVRRKAMLTAARMDHHEAIPHLMTVVEGNQILYGILPHIPPDELVYVPAGFDNVAGKRHEVEVAALSLGYLKYIPAEKVIRTMSDSPMKDVALALLGEMEKLKPEHFMLEERNRELQLAAVEAVIRSKGQVGLKWAIDYKQSTHWWEPEYVLKRLKKMLIANNAPGIERVQNAASLKELDEWYSQYGESYLKQINT
ncbi:MAG: hypothetical protein V3V05_00270 [Pontiella sp.]